MTKQIKCPSCEGKGLLEFNEEPVAQAGSIADIQFQSHPKVRTAKRLLLEADQELRAARQARVNATICECGDRFDEHTPSHNVNYTAGACRKCKPCMNFLMSGNKVVGKVKSTIVPVPDQTA